MATPDNIRDLYNALSKAGYNDIGTEDDFRAYVQDSNNVSELYDALAREGYNDIGTKDEFRGWLQPAEQPQEAQPAQAPTPQAYNPATFAPMARPQQQAPNVRAPFANEEAQRKYEQQRAAAQPKPQPTQEQARPLGPERFQREMEEQQLEQAIGNVEDSHSRFLENIRKKHQPFGNNQIDAMAPARQQRMREEQKYNSRVQLDELKGDIDNRIAEIQRQATSDWRTRDEKRGFWENAARSLADTPDKTGNVAEETARMYEEHPELRELTAASRSIRNAMQVIGEADHNAKKGTFESSWFAGLGRGFGQKLSDVRTWDMGLTDVQDNSAILKALEAFDRGEQLTESQQALLDAKAIELCVNEYFGSEVGRGYKAGATTAEAIPFMIEMVANPLLSAGRGATRLMARYAVKRFGKEAAKKVGSKIFRGAIRGLADVVGSAAGTATTGAIGTYAGTLDRMIGDLQYDTDKDGNVVFSGHENMEDPLTALGKEFSSQTIERWSEMAGVYNEFIPKVLGKLMGKGFNKIGLGAVTSFFERVPKTQWGKAIGNFMERTQWHGPIGEFLEEIEGGTANALMHIDQTLDSNPDTGVFNKDNLIDTFEGVAVMGVMFAGAGTLGYVRGRANLRKADKKADLLFGNYWPEIRDLMTNGSYADRHAIMEKILSDPTSSEEQKEALLDYDKWMLANALRENVTDRVYADPSEMAAGVSFDNGYFDADTEEKRYDAYIDLGEKENAVRTLLGDETFERLEDAPIDVQKELEQNGNLTDEQRQAIADYVAVKYRVEGIEQRINDDADMMAAEQREEAKARTNKNDGAMHPATLKEVDADGNPKEVFVVDGNFAMDDDGNISGDDVIVVYDPVEGKNREISPMEISSLGEVTSAEQQVQNIEANKQAYIQQQMDAATGRFNPQPGQLIDMPDGNKAVVLAVDGENVTLQMPDGTQQSMAIADIQQIADGVAMEDYRQRHPEAQHTAVAEQPVAEQPKGAPETFEPMMELTIKDKDGNEQQVVVTGGRARFTGKGYEEDPNGKFVELYVVGSEEPRYIRDDELKKMVADYKEAEQPAAEVEQPTEAAAEQSTEDGAVPAGESAETAAAPAVAPEAEVDPMEAPIPTKMVERTRTVTDKDGKKKREKYKEEVEDFSGVSAERAYKYYYVDNADLYNNASETDKDVAKNLKDAEDNLSKLQTKLSEATGSVAVRRRIKDELTPQIEEAQNEVQLWKDVQAIRENAKREEMRAMLEEQERKDAERHEQAVAQREADMAEAAAKKAEQESIGANATNPIVRDRWNAAPKVEGYDTEFNLPNGETIDGRYVLVESGAATPSHDPNNNFESSEGYPVDANGNNINDRDYKRSPDAMEHTRNMAANYDGRALQSIPVVSREGVVLSGNGRTMAGMLAAQNGTDGVYKEKLRKRAREFGFTPEQVEAMQHPRVVFVPKEDMPYATETLAKFNESNEKQMSPVEKAFKYGKMVDDDTFGRIMRHINGFTSLAEFYADRKATDAVLGEMITAGIYNKNDVPSLYDGEKLSESTKADIESILIGKFFEKNPDMVNMIVDMPAVRQKVVKAMQEIADNANLGEDYSLQQQFADAVKLVYDAKNAGSSVADHAKQFGIDFETGEVNTAADINNLCVLMLSDVLSDKSVNRLKDVLTLYNDRSRDASQGQGNIFAENDSGVQTREEILKEVINTIYHGRISSIREEIGRAVGRRQEESRAQDEPAVRGLEGQSGEGASAAEQPTGEVAEQPKQQKVDKSRPKAVADEAAKAAERGLDELLGRVLGNDYQNTVEAGQQVIDMANGDVQPQSAAPTFYSNAERAVEGIKQDKATAEQWLAMIQKNGGLKAGEDKWIGLSDWLNDHKGKSLTKQEVLDYIRENQIQVEEVKYGDALFSPNSKINLETELKKGKDEGKSVSDVLEAWDKEFGDTKLNDWFAGRFIVDNNGNIETAEESRRPINNTRRQYTTDGLENKREIALVVPTVEPWNEGDDVHFGDAGEGRAVAWVRFGDAYEIDDTEIKEASEKARSDYRNYRDSLKEKYGDDFKSKMTDGERQELVRLFDAMTEANAKVIDGEGAKKSKVLVIDEIQSKRHQEGREKGYRTKDDIAEEERLVDATVEAQDRYDEYTRMMANKYGGSYEDIYGDMTEREQQKAEQLRAAVALADEAYQNHKMGDIPDAPFEKNWHEMAFKRMLRYAAENGYDKVAWTTGEQQAERYDISKAVNKINAGEWGDWNGDEETRSISIDTNNGDTLVFDVNKNGVITRVESDAERLGIEEGSKLSDVVGKDLAKELLSEGPKAIEGNGLRIGGGGMKGFYDQILPRFMDKYGKKWGVKTTDIELPNIGDNGLTMHSVDVTPEMKASVLEGQPMFHRVFHGSGADFERFDSSHMGEGEGAQSYGYGHYVTEVESIGHKYAQDIGDSTKPATFKGLNVQALEYKNQDFFDSVGATDADKVSALLEIVRSLNYGYGNPARMIQAKRESLQAQNRSDAYVVKRKTQDLERETDEAKRKRLEDSIKYYEGKIEKTNDVLKFVDSLDPKDFEGWKGNKGHYLYEVEIPEDNGRNYLEWDKKVDGTDGIFKALEAAGFSRMEGEDVVYGKDGKGEFLFYDKNFTGEDLYKSLSMFLGSDRAASEFLHSAGFTGIKYPAQYRSGGREDNAKNYVIFDDNDLKITDKVKFFRTANGTAYGFTYKSKIYIDPRIATSETRIHEYAHIWAQALRTANPEAWEKLKAEMAGQQDVMDYVKKLYPELKNEDDLMEEVFTHYSGKRGAERLENDMREAMAKEDDLIEKAKVASVFHKLRDLLQKFWSMARDLFAVNNKRLAKMKAEDFADMMMGDLLHGVDPRKEAKMSEATEAIDKKYMEAVEKGDMETAQRMVDEAAREAGYTANDDYKDGHHAPASSVYRKDFRNLEAIRETVENDGAASNLFAMAQGVSLVPDDYFSVNGPRWYGYQNWTGGMEAYYNLRNVINEIQRQVREYGEVKDMPTIKVYRAVPKDIKAGQLESGGQWVSPSREYAVNHGRARFGFGEYRVIEQEVRADELWFDGNDIREWGFDDDTQNAYQNTKNNRKSLDAVTYDDNGNVIPLSKRFNKRNADIRFQKAGVNDSDVTEPFKAPAKEQGEDMVEYAKRVADAYRVYNETRKQDDASDILKDTSISMRERMTAVAARLAENNAGDATAKNNAYRAIGGNLADLRKAMGIQKEFDKTTVKRVADLAKILLQGGYLDGASRSEISRILSAVKNATGKADISGDIRKVMDIMVESQLRNAENALRDMEKIKASKVDAKGVEVQGALDVAGQQILKTFKETRGWSEDELSQALAYAENRMASDDQAVADEAAAEYAGLQMALDYVQNIHASKVEERELKQELDDARHAVDRSMEYENTLLEAIQQNKIERIQAYHDLMRRLGDTMRGSIAAAREFKEADKERVREIQHNANSDMEGRPSDEHYQPDFKDKFVNNSLVQFLFSPLSTFDQMLRLFGNKSANGEGYLYNRFMRGWVDAREKEIRGVRGKYAELDAKVKSLFGNEAKNMGELIRKIGSLPKMNVEFWDGGEMKEHTLTQGNLLYIYMVNKMLDGRMKLRKMGIDEKIVDTITRNLDPRLIELADWMQDEFLVNTRNEYNETHKRVFGAPMAAIENYFPLKILSNARVDKAEDLDNFELNDGISTKTGSIIKRRRNALALDIMGADALNVILDHVAQMEHWNAFAEYNRDLNTLRTYKRFRNQVKNMNTIYGSGDKLWQKFNDVAQMSSGSYRPKRANLDAAAVNFAKGVTAAKVSFRIFTALKQFLSMPAYIPDARPDLWAKNLATPWKSWNWAMENLPIFEERWKSRMAGDPRLMKSELDWKGWRNNIVQIASRIGMSPNAFVDALTVSIGARTIYETRKARYLKEGYSEEQADKRAKQDAEIAYNQTQQSSEGAFLSPMQVDRSWLSVMFTVFRNASMAYQRQLNDAVRNLKRDMTKGNKAKSVEFMAKQMVREGVPEDKAEEAAKQRYNRQIGKDILRVATFGYILQLAWNLGAKLPYLLFGDDDDKKKEMMDDVWAQSMFGWGEGLTGGDVFSQAGKMAVQGNGNPEYLTKEMPIASDAKDILQEIGNGKYGEVINDMVNLAVQIGVGVNPQSITDAVLAIMDASGNDPELAKESMIAVMRILQVPQSQIKEMYFDEVGLSGDEVSNYTPEQLAERYARYQVKRGRLLAPWTWDDKKLFEKEQKKAETAIKERMEVSGDKQVNEEYKTYEEQYKSFDEQFKEYKATPEYKNADPMEKAELLDYYRQDNAEGYAQYDLFKSMDATLTKWSNYYLEARTDRQAQTCKKAIEDYKKQMVAVMDATNDEQRNNERKKLADIIEDFYKEYGNLMPTRTQEEKLDREMDRTLNKIDNAVYEANQLLIQ